MVIDLICENNSNKLCDPGKNQISMQSPLILGSASCKTEIVFDVVDISFDNSPDFIGIIPFFGAADRSVSTVTTNLVFFYHFIGNRICVSVFGHRLMECRIEYKHLRGVRR